MHNEVYSAFFRTACDMYDSFVEVMDARWKFVLCFILAKQVCFLLPVVVWLLEWTVWFVQCYCLLIRLCLTENGLIKCHCFSKLDSWEHDLFLFLNFWPHVQNSTIIIEDERNLNCCLARANVPFDAFVKLFDIDRRANGLSASTWPLLQKEIFISDAAFINNQGLLIAILGTVSIFTII